MLVRYKKSQEKIAMGLLSFMPTEKDVKKLQQTIKQYEENDNWQLFFWKEEDDFIGITGLQLSEDHIAEMQHICVNPSHRGQGIGQKMFKSVQSLLGKEYQMVPNVHTESFYHKCESDTHTKTE